MASRVGFCERMAACAELLQCSMSLGPCSCLSPRCKWQVPQESCGMLPLQLGTGAGRPCRTARPPPQQGCTIIPHLPPSPALRARQGGGTGSGTFKAMLSGAHHGRGICPLRKCLYLLYISGWSLGPPPSLVPKAHSLAPQSSVGGGASDTLVHL